MTTITIVGGGQAGLLLALGLQAKGIGTRLVQNRDAANILNGRVMSTQCVFGNALAFERSLGLDFWQKDAPIITGLRVRIGDPGGSGKAIIDFTGNLAREAVSVDQRLKFAKWLDLYVERGGLLEIRDAGLADLAHYAESSDLVVVAAGKGDVSALFERDAARSTYDAPQRALSLVYCNGVTPYDKTCVTANVIPGKGELFQIPCLTKSGPCEIMFFEAIPGGPLDHLDAVDMNDAAGHLAQIKALIRAHAPWEYDRIANATPTDGLCNLKGRVQPTIRQPVGRLPNGKIVLGLADAVLLNDPITGQGSNNAIKAAEIYLDAIAGHGGAFDETWMRATFEKAYARTAAATLWTNAMLQPPPDHVVGLFATAQGRPDLADRIADGFDEPGTMLPLYGDPAAAMAEIQKAA